jgi:8-oxo-dGTP diphosphatase
MTIYVCGFLFDEDFKRAVLIQKLKPKWQEGLLNGIGGKLELGESVNEAMRREFLEEAGLDIEDWKMFTTLSDNLKEWIVFFFVSISNHIDDVKTMEEERVKILDLKDIPKLKIVQNLSWLIPLAIDSYIQGFITDIRTS